MAKSKKLQQYIISSWLISGAMAVVASIFLFFIFGYYNYNRETTHAQSNLDARTEIFARRLSGELLIEPRGAPESVAFQLKKDLNFLESYFGTHSEINAIKRDRKFIYSQMPVPFLEDQYLVLTVVPKVRLSKHFNLTILFLSFALIGILVGFGLVLQTRYLKKHLIKPIEALVDTSTGEKLICENWPTELKEISQKLSSSFQQREQAIYNQIARGVIHDIKTILQSMQVATDLASEAPSEMRLNNLLKVSKSKLPSLLEIIDTALDGSREITVNAHKNDLVQTIQKSIETSQMLAVAKNTEIQFITPHTAIEATHDPIQMERVFTNLLKNAFEAVETKDTEQKKIKVSFQLEDKDFVTIHVEDSGIGLPKQPESIFRLLKSTKTHGSGLGLRVSRKIVEAHNGTLTAMQSEELNGAKFEVKIPSEVQL